MPQFIAPGVVQVATSFRGINAFLVADDGRDIAEADGFTLIDVGWASAVPTIVAALKGLGRSVTDIQRIVLTHAHPDHVAGVADLRDLSAAQVFIHEQDASWVGAGRVPAFGRSGWQGRLLDRLPALRWQPFAPDGLLSNGQLVPGSAGLRVLHTPGHTAGHLAFVHEPSRVVFVGDAVVHRRGQLSLGFAALAQFPQARRASVALLPVDVAAVGFAHGTPLEGDELAPYRRLVAESAAGR